MKKFVAVAIAGAFLGAVSLTTFSPAAMAADKVSACEKMKNEKAKEKCLTREAAKAAKKAERDAKKAEREAARAAKKAERDAKKAEREAARAAKKAEREAAKKKP